MRIVLCTSGRFTFGGWRQSLEKSFPLKMDRATSESFGMAKYVLMNLSLAIRLRSFVISTRTPESRSSSKWCSYFFDESIGLLVVRRTRDEKVVEPPESLEARLKIKLPCPALKYC